MADNKKTAQEADENKNTERKEDTEKNENMGNKENMETIDNEVNSAMIEEKGSDKNTLSDGDIKGSQNDVQSLSFVGLSSIIVYPGIPVTIDISDKNEVLICRNSYKSGEEIFLVMQKESARSAILPTPEDFCETGVIGKIKSFEKNENGARIVFIGRIRARVTGPAVLIGIADVEEVYDIPHHGEYTVRDDVRINTCKRYYSEMTSIIPHFPDELKKTVLSESSLSKMIDSMAFSAFVNDSHKQGILDENDVMKRLELLENYLSEELEYVYNEMDIHKKVRKRLDDNQREYYLREQLKVINEELGEVKGGSGVPSLDDEYEDDDELEEYRRKIISGKFPKEVEEKLQKEVGKLAKTPYGSAESTVIRNYLDVCLEIPWSKKSADKANVEKAKAQLDKDHYGLEKVKDRILEYIAVRQLTPDVRNQIICLVGAPGVGKTSIASSIAKAMGRKYVRVSLGGVRDEADIRGHRKTYVASMPGRIVNALIQSGVNNPLILLDEIDKLSSDYKGDPTSAILEVLDSEQNKTFRDHFVEIPVDLSDCVFIATANTLEGVPRPLIDRMEIIELPIYNRREKFEIAKNFLFPKQMKRHGLTKSKLKIKDEVYYELADFYTHEAGVRSLEREIAGICRKAAKMYVENGKGVTVSLDNLKLFSGERKIIPDVIYDHDEVGTVNGLAFTELGGEMLRVEAVAMEGTGKAQFTGSIGGVMKESAEIAVSYIRNHAQALGIDPSFYKNKDLHIHFPEGAIPKDGPSAGVALVCAIASELGGYPARRDVAMTGEITLHGRVLPIGGLKEKTMAAYKAGVNTVLVPEDNRKDIPELDESVRNNINFVYCREIGDALKNALRLPEGRI